MSDPSSSAIGSGAAAKPGLKGFVFRLVPPRADFPFTMSDAEAATMADHVGYWAELAAKGSAVAFGPVADPAGVYGIGIVLAGDLSAAEAIRDGDPANRSPHGFVTEIAPMLSLVTPERRYGAT